MRISIGLAVLLVALGCRGSSKEPRAQVVQPNAAAAVDKRAAPADDESAKAPAEDFTQPDAEGWGRAAGLRYLEQCVGACAEGAEVPMAILIHGLGDRPRHGWLEGASHITAPLRLIMPQAPTPYYDGFAWFPYRIRDNDPDQLASGIAGAAKQLARAIAQLAAQRPTAGKPMVMGFSQGGMLSFALALRHPEGLALSLPISGMLPEPLWPADKPSGRRFPRILALHGDADEIVPIDPARGLVRRLKELDYEVEFREYPGVGHHITPAMEAVTLEMLNAHARRAAL